MSETLTVRGDS